MKCPQCESDQLIKTISPNGGLLEVHEHFIPLFTEIYDNQVTMFECNDCQTVFYISQNREV